MNKQCPVVQLVSVLYLVQPFLETIFILDCKCLHLTVVLPSNVPPRPPSKKQRQAGLKAMLSDGVWSPK